MFKNTVCKARDATPGWALSGKLFPLKGKWCCFSQGLHYFHWFQWHQSSQLTKMTQLTSSAPADTCAASFRDVGESWDSPLCASHQWKSGFCLPHADLFSSLLQNSLVKFATAVLTAFFLRLFSNLIAFSPTTPLKAERKINQKKSIVQQSDPVSKKLMPSGKATISGMVIGSYSKTFLKTLQSLKKGQSRLKC